MRILRSFLILCQSVFLITGVYAQKNSKFEVKMRPGFVVHSLPNNEYTALGSANDILIVSNGAGVTAKKIDGQSGEVIDLDSDAKGEQLLSTSKKGAILWDIEGGIQLHSFVGHNKGLINARFIDDSKIATIGNDNKLIVWDIFSGKMINSYMDHQQNIQSMDAANGITVTGDKEGNVIARDINQDSVIFKAQLSVNITEVELDGKGIMAFVGAADGQIIVLDLTEGKIISRVDNGRGSINDLSMASDNKHLVVSSRDVKIYNTQNMTLVREMDQVASAVIGASFTPDGKSLFFIEEFSPKAECIDVSELNIAYSVNFKDESDKTPPQIYLASPAKIVDNRVVHYEGKLAIRGSVIDDYGVQQLKINGISTPLKSNGNFVINLPLTMGDNFITIEVTDINQNTALKKFVVNRKNLDGTDYDPAVATNYLLVIGINKYEHWPQLYNAVKDANDVVSTLLGMYSFEFANVTLITDEQATRSNIYNKLREFVGKVGPKDNFMIYYSGHGYFDELLNEGYWVPSDARVNQTGDYLSNSDISKIIANIDSQHTFLVADACFSGSLFNESSRGYAENVEKFRSRWGLASGRLETVSDGEIGANSPFAQSFISFLKENDKDKVAVSQLVQYVKIEVAEVSDQTPIGNPLKGVGDEGGEFVFYKKGY